MSRSSFWNSVSSPFPFRGVSRIRAESCDVAVIGSGITGLTSAYLLQQSGASVVILDKSGVAEGDTARSTGHVTVEIDVPYHELLARMGRGRARRVLASQMASLRQIESTVHELGINCGFERVPGHLFAEDAAGAREIEREFHALNSLGAPVSLLGTRGMPFAVNSAMRIENQAQMNPPDYCRGLVAAFLERGGKIFADSVVTEVEDGMPCRIRTASGGEISAKSVLVCAHSAFLNRLFIHTKVASYRSYVIGAELDGLDGWDGLYWDVAKPYHYLRTVKVEGKAVLLLGGEDRKTGNPENSDERFRQLENYLTKRSAGASVLWRWSGQIVSSLDGLPFIGRNPLDRNVFIATGFAGNGLTQGTLAALLLRDAVLGRENPWSDLYLATRFLGPGQLSRFLIENKDFALYSIKDRVTPAASLDTLARGEGGIVEIDGTRAAAFRDESGHWRAFNPSCPHLGCFVHFNQTEQTWDCPCHGSRFDLDGRVLNGPAVSGLTPLSTEGWPQTQRKERRAKRTKRSASGKKGD